MMTFKIFDNILPNMKILQYLSLSYARMSSRYSDEKRQKLASCANGSALADNVLVLICHGMDFIGVNSPGY